LVKDCQQQLYQLRQLLFHPLERYLPNAAQLIVVPDGELQLLPFHAFYDGHQYLVERYQFAYTPSATVLGHCVEQPRRGEGAFLCGYEHGDLPAVQEEMRVLARLFPQAVVRLGAEATTLAFTTQAPRCQIIHLAAHAAFHRERPMLSAIALADRRLTLAEIVRLRLGATLVVLSGCETAYGKSHDTDFVSLASGFLGAGAQALLVSLWAVEDRITAHLMETFYRTAQHGSSLSVALGNAQRTMLEQGRMSNQTAALYQHPAFWAPFLLMGNAMASI
jgi:CHAT domain-containing protein